MVRLEQGGGKGSRSYVRRPKNFEYNTHQYTLKTIKWSNKWLEWPAQLPDLNSIENPWSNFKKDDTKLTIDCLWGVI